MTEEGGRREEGGRKKKWHTGRPHTPFHVQISSDEGEAHVVQLCTYLLGIPLVFCSKYCLVLLEY